MRFLLDQNLSPALAKALNEDGHEAVHISEYGMEYEVDDNKILDRAAAERRILISRDSDFQSLLHQRQLRPPAIIHLPQKGAPHLPSATPDPIRAQHPIPRGNPNPGRTGA